MWLSTTLTSDLAGYQRDCSRDEEDPAGMDRSLDQLSGAEIVHRRP
ncbi:hypothetical protein [Massilia mucilaginosa]|nr:hypothetical protein [Massilia mucilaginosa]